MVQSRVAKVIALAVVLCLDAVAQLNQNCTVAVLNRTVQANPDGTWVLPNVPAGTGQVKARATCVQNGITTSGESTFFAVPANGAVNLPAITLGTTTAIPDSLLISPVPTLNTVGQTAQLTVTAHYPDNSTRNVTAAGTGTNYTISNSAIATITANGLVTAVSSGTVVIQASNDGASGIITIQVVLSGASHGGIPDSWAISFGLDINDPTMPSQDPDRDGLTNLQEFQAGTNPNNPDTDGDGLTDGDEVARGTSPLLRDTDGDGISDGLEVQTGTNPLDPRSYNLGAALSTLSVNPPSASLVVNSINPNASIQLTVRGNLKDNSTIDLTLTNKGTIYTSSNLQVCNFGAPDGRVFAGSPGSCTITVKNNGFEALVPVTVTNFTPGPVSNLSLPGSVAVDVAGNYLFAAAGANGLYVVNITNRSAPQVVRTVPLAGNANDVRISGGFAYVAGGAAGLHVISISTPTAASRVATLDTPGDAQDVAVRGGTAYVADGAAGLQIIDVTTPASPRLLGSINVGATVIGVDADPVREVAALALGGGGLRLVDVSNPAAPALRGLLTGGTVEDVVVRGTVAYLADLSNSFTAVDISNPNVPILSASLPPQFGGRLYDVFYTGNFAFGADVFFVNGVPIVDISQPLAPTARAILNFPGDATGTGISADGSFIYLIADTVLYIGQYQQIVDTGGIPPSVLITSPGGVTPLIQGSTITLSANAVDDVAVASVTFLVNGQPVFTTATPPYQTSYTVPATATTLTFGATAVDYGNNVGNAPSLLVQVIPDPGTTVTGKVVDGAGNPVSGATVNAAGPRSSTTAVDGTFSIAQVPTILGNVQVRASIVTGAGITLAGLSNAIPPVLGGNTTVGTITIVPFPVIFSLSQKSALAGTQASLQITGTTLGSATFSFLPGSSPPISLQVVSTSLDGTSATLALTIPATALGTAALVATNAAGNSGTAVTQVNRFTVVDPNSAADTDGDGSQDAIEAAFGTDPLDPGSKPVIPRATETESVAFSMLNASVTGAGITETESIAFSVLNAPVTGAGIAETESVAFSVLNAPVTGAGISETESIAFSVLNAPAGTSGINETESLPASVRNLFTGQQNNSATPAHRQPKAGSDGIGTDSVSAGGGGKPAPLPPIDPLLDSDGDGLPDWYETLIGTDPYNRDTDGDGLTDFEEIFKYHTNPLDPDTDHDGFTDGIEVLSGSDPLNPASIPVKPRGPALAAGPVIKKNSTVQGGANVKPRSRTQARGKAANTGSGSNNFLPRRPDR